MPLFRRLPKRGFNNAAFKVSYIGVNLEELNQFDDGARVDEQALKAAGLANGKSHGVKILGRGELTKKLTVVVSAFSATAKAQIEAKGGSCEVLPKKVQPAKFSAQRAAAAKSAQK